MAQGDGHRVGGVVRLRNGAQIQQTAGHIHDLPLLRLSVAHHRLLDLAGGILKDGHPPALRRQQENSPGLGHADARSDIVVEKQLLHCHGLGLELGQQQVHIVGDLPQTCGQGLPCRCGNCAALHQALTATIGLHQPKAHNGKAGVYA